MPPDNTVPGAKTKNNTNSTPTPQALPLPLNLCVSASANCTDRNSRIEAAKKQPCRQHEGIGGLLHVALLLLPCAIVIFALHPDDVESEDVVLERLMDTLTTAETMSKHSHYYYW